MISTGAGMIFLTTYDADECSTLGKGYLHQAEPPSACPPPAFQAGDATHGLGCTPS